MDLRSLDKEAEAAALQEIKNMFQRSGQLEKIDTFRHRIQRKKMTDETLLKSALNQQLNSVGSGLEQLKLNLSDAKEVEERIKNIQQLIENVPNLADRLEPVKEENTKYSQYVTAMENLKHIFTVQASVEKALDWIKEDKLLLAHQCLSDLENSRDDLLFELHKLTKQNTHDKITLKCYFDKVETVSTMLQDKLRFIFKRTLNTARKEPTVIVTALRIVEREEKADQFALQQQKLTGFLPPGRPKEWRSMLFHTLNESVEERIVGSIIENRNEKLWLVKDLELMRQLILDDLKVVKSVCLPCFPPGYNILKEYVKMYHRAVSDFLEQLVRRGIEGNEYVTLLSWIINTYPGKELMQNPELRIDLSEIENIQPLMKPQIIKTLETAYLKTMEKNYTDWMDKTVETEKNDWQAGMPDQDDQFFHTASPVIIFQMIDQHLQVTNTIKQDLTFNALILSIQQVTVYGQKYRLAIIDFKEKHFKDRSQVPFFTHHIITIVNNCQQIIDLAQQIKQLYWPKTRTDHYEDFEKLLQTFQALRDETAFYLLEEAFLDLDGHFNELFSAKWISSTIAIDTICVTLQDYFQDYNHLRVINFEFVIKEAQKMVAKRYIRALLSKRISKPRNECEIIVKKVVNEVRQIKSFFEKIAPNFLKNDSPFDAIIVLSQLLCCDTEMIILDLHTLLTNYPSITEDHLIRLFYIRNEIKSNEIREKIQDAFSSRKVNVSTHDKLSSSIFKEITFNETKLWSV
ncbi:CLUMA_CG000126, isoform A [Clunio marinus]|uniref:CLUMA_CG000126, isoform A n=1 Tax=Clunio marinus TaxID=568069 RepID=A0A1J1HDQ8_9DIPT|nr:CLUMA_CG000126, isoform A [Clunio marinus]